MMKKCFFVLAALACCACSKGVENYSSEKDGEVVELSFSVPVKATKASGNVTEDAIESLQVFVFGKDGQVQSSGIAEENSLTLTCTTGEKQIAAVVNAEALNGVNTLEQLKAKMSDFGDNTLDGFVMSGLKPETLSASGSVTVPVSRLVSKVKLSSVTNSFRLSQHQAMEFRLMSVFMTNAPQQTGYFYASQSSQMINDGVSDINDIIAASGDLLYDELGDVEVAMDETIEVDNFLYCYPNMKSVAGKPAYLVVQTRLGDGIYYYSVELPKMESNKCYNVSLTVTMPGSLTPDVPVKKEDAVFSVSVTEWAGNVEVNETI